MTLLSTATLFTAASLAVRRQPLLSSVSSSGVHAVQSSGYSLQAQPDPRCQGREDGMYGDSSALPPYSGFFECREEDLVRIEPCTPGHLFAAPLGRCNDPGGAWTFSQARTGRWAPGILGEGSEEVVAERGEVQAWQGRGTRSGARGGGWAWVVPASLASPLAGARAFMEGMRGRLEPGAGKEARRRRFLLRLQIGNEVQRMDYYNGTKWPQVNALLAFKSRVLDFTGRLRNWRVPLHSRDPAFVCSWAGVTCAGPRVGGRGPNRRRGGSTGAATWDVVAVDLNNTLPVPNPPDSLVPALQGNWQPLWARQGVNQSLPPQLGDLTALTLLDLSQNGFYRQGQYLPGMVGPIPEEISRCTRLRVLHLGGNRLTGTIPPSLSLLRGLQSLDLSYTSLQGSLPQGVMGALRQLTSLQLSFTNLTGSLPPAVSSLALLSSLSLGSIPLTGPLPGSLGRMPSLQSLNLAYLPFVSGPIPDSLSQLTSLSQLSIKSCNLSGTLPAAPWWRALSSLSQLAVSRTPVGGPLPSSFGPALQYLQINSTLVSGGLSEALQRSLCSPGKLLALTYLQITNNPQLGGTFPAGLSSCPSLAYLLLSNNGLEGEVPGNFFSRLASVLDRFEVQDNHLSGSLPRDVLQRMTNIADFDLSNNNFSGPAPVFSCTSDNINGLFIAGNRFEGDIAEVLGNRARCKFVTGENKAYTFLLAGNRLTGKLPQDWAVGMVELQAAGNNISGPLASPAAPKQCMPGEGFQGLQTVNLSKNHLSGEFPSSLLGCTNLVSVDLSENAMSGALRFGGSALWQQQQQQGGGSAGRERPRKAWNSTLVTLLLAGNNFTGTVPNSLQALGSLRALDLSRNGLAGEIPPGLTLLRALESLNLSTNALSGPIPTDLGLASSLVALSLAHNALSGPIPLQLAPPFLASLTALDLSHNLLTGPVPYGFANDSVLALGLLDLSGNNLSGPVPGGDSGPFSASAEGGKASALANNPALCGGAGYPVCPGPDAGSPNSLSAGAIVGIIVGCLAVVAAAAALLVWWFLYLRPDGSCTRDQWKRGLLLCFRHFDPPLTMRVVLDATDNFSCECEVGRGGFGQVYRAVLADGTELAIKRMKLRQNREGDDDGFKAELSILGRLVHRNLVPLLAAYVAAPPHHERLLFYEFMPGGSLDKVLSPDMPENSIFRHFEVRHKMLVDVARGLKYLHHDCNPPIIHRDMKPANVLLDAEQVARVADFGLATEIELGRTHMTEIGHCGTAGYVAPEYASLGRLSFKSDVYAFGVTLIQIISGRNTASDEVAEAGLQRWARNQGSGIVDPTLGEEQINEAVGLIKIGLLCCSRVPVDRPTMLEVLEILENLEEFLRCSNDSTDK